MGQTFTQSESKIDNNEKNIIFPSWEKYETYHKEFIQEIVQKGITLPEWDDQKKGWYDEASNTGPSSSWENGYLNALGAPNCYTNALQLCKSKLNKMQENDEDMDRYFKEMEQATNLNIQMKSKFSIFHASRNGAKLFANDISNIAKNTLRVCLENKDGLDSLTQQHFAYNLYVPLDDSSPFSRVPSMGKNEYEQFTNALGFVINWLQESKGHVLIHCSQGQSRSGLFVVCLLFILHKIDNIQSDDLNLGTIISMVSMQRNILDFSPRWYSFLPFFCSNTVVDK